MTDTDIFWNADDVHSPVPASYPYEQQLADGAASIADQQAQSPAPDPFAVTLADEAGTLQATSQSKTKTK